MSKQIHFHSSDERFCGTDDLYRQFTLDRNEVTCFACAELDALEITQDGLVYLKALESCASLR